MESELSTREFCGRSEVVKWAVVNGGGRGDDTDNCDDNGGGDNDL